MKRIFSKKEKQESKEKVKKRFLHKKIYIAIMLILILLIISMSMFARSNGIRNFRDIKNFVNNKLNSEQPQQAGPSPDNEASVAAVGSGKTWADGKYLSSEFAPGTIFYSDKSKIDWEKSSGFNQTNATSFRKVDGKFYYAQTEKGKLKIRITKCAIDANGDLCDVIISTSKSESWDGYDDRSYTGADFTGTNISGKRNASNGKIGGKHIKNIIDIHKSGHLWAIWFNSDCATTEFTIKYVKAGTTSKAAVNSVFCTMVDVDVEATESNIPASVPFGGNEGVEILSGGTKKIIYEKHTYKNGEIDAAHAVLKKSGDSIYRNSNATGGYRSDCSTASDKWYGTAGLIIKDTDAVVKMKYSGPSCAMGLRFNSPYVYDLPKPIKKIRKNADKPKEKDSNTVKENEAYQYIINQHIPNSYDIRELRTSKENAYGDVLKNTPPYQEITITDTLPDELEFANNIKSKIKVQNELGANKTDWFDIKRER